MRVIGYAFEADLHCVDCTRFRFPDLGDDTEDREGNFVHPIFSTDEAPESGDWVCGDCFDTF